MDNNIENAGTVEEIESSAAANNFAASESYSVLAVIKIAKELETFTGGQKENTVSKFVASTLTHFCEENERFAEVVYKTPRTLSDCCAEVMSGVGSSVSDIDVYRGAVQSYFPNADISFKMEIQITGDVPTEEEIARPPKKKTPAPRKASPPKTGAKGTAAPIAKETGKVEPKKKPDKKLTIETLQLSLF